MGVRVEHASGVTTVILDRPAARNAVDGPTARALADAFRTFEADPDAPSRCSAVPGAVLARSDLKAIGTPASGNRVEPAGTGPMGPPAWCSQSGIAAISGYAWPADGAGALVRPASPIPTRCSGLLPRAGGCR